MLAHEPVKMNLPSVILRYAGGREITLRDMQAMGMTAGINALIVGNYLTTLGRRVPQLRLVPVAGRGPAPAPVASAIRAG